VRGVTWNVKYWLSSEYVDEWLVRVGNADVDEEKDDKKHSVDDVARHVIAQQQT